jgi:hypothetical protein
MLAGDNMAIPLLHDAGVDPGHYTPLEAFVVSLEILRPVIEMKLTPAASGCTPTHAPGFIEDVDAKAAVGQQA